ncbi:multifunctional protein ADE2 isoform X2 [Brienomyrus brachyistius]|uniref:multifunctional protein ADE2 isoform X2 n=1 Tax=Brienomyrus brachyistius TaxID=42636 RepID=UPI0020B3FD68|nr:multifunctional protein ADE2 isoform X2 [Brienomyrus brachyistius]
MEGEQWREEEQSETQTREWVRKREEECEREQESVGEEGEWAEEEVRALLAVWAEEDIQRGLRGASRDKAIFMHMSSRLHQLGVFRDWRQCLAKCSCLQREYHSSQPRGGAGLLGDMDAVITPEYLAKEEGEEEEEEEEEEDEQGDEQAFPRWAPNRPEERSGVSPSATDVLREGGQCLIREPRFIPSVASEGGKHWTDEEVQALLYIWADPIVQRRLQGTVRNKSIFQEVAQKLQSFGVHRDWKQCRSKYKNLKYDYKNAKTSGVGYLGKTMKFFREVEAILEGRAMRTSRAGELSFRRGPEGDRGVLWKGPEGERAVLWKAQEADRATVRRTQESEQASLGSLRRRPEHSNDVDEADIRRHLKSPTASVEHSPQPCMPPEARAISGQNDLGPLRVWPFCPPAGNRGTPEGNLDQFQVTVGRNWSDEEVRALILVCSDTEVLQRLERSTRNKDIFMQISGRLLQLGVDRDWKQCRTKYKNLKYLYSALQKGQGVQGHPRRVMRLYHEVDAILKNSRDAGGREQEVQAAPVNLSPATVLYRTDSQEGPTSSTNTSTEIWVSSKLIPYGDSNEDSCTSPITDFQCKEEQDEYIPIIQINSVYSMTTPMTAAQRQEQRFPSEMASASELKHGKKLNEGKTKQIFELPEQPGHVLVQSKDQITAGNAARKDQMEGKAAISNKTTSAVFRLLQDAGIKTAFVGQQSDTAFVALHCEMIPIEWVCRRLATGSFLKRNPGVQEGYRFSPVKLEMFFKDDANNDPQWSEEQLIEAKFSFGGLDIGRCEVDIMNRSTVAIFEILEKAWATQNCTLVDMKIEFGVNVVTKEIVLADVIDNDSWRLWPAGDRKQQKDKQVYRDLQEVTPEAMQMVKRNFEWVSDRVQLLLESQTHGRVVVLMGSASDLAHCERIRSACGFYGVPCHLRVTSAHKGPDETLRIKAEYEGDGVPTVFVAVAGRSNGLGPVLSGNTAYPVISCPPLTPDWGAQDVWSSLRLPSGLGCTTVLSPDAAAQSAAQILGLSDHLVWAKLRAVMLNTWISLKQADKKLQACNL